MSYQYIIQDTELYINIEEPTNSEIDKKLKNATYPLTIIIPTINNYLYSNNVTFNSECYGKGKGETEDGQTIDIIIRKYKYYEFYDKDTHSYINYSFDINNQINDNITNKGVFPFGFTVTNTEQKIIFITMDNCNEGVEHDQVPPGNVSKVVSYARSFFTTPSQNDEKNTKHIISPEYTRFILGSNNHLLVDDKKINKFLIKLYGSVTQLFGYDEIDRTIKLIYYSTAYGIYSFNNNTDHYVQTQIIYNKVQEKIYRIDNQEIFDVPIILVESFYQPPDISRHLLLD